MYIPQLENSAGLIAKLEEAKYVLIRNDET